MGRANTIIVGSVVLAPLVLGIEGYAVFRPHRRARAAAPALDEAAPAPVQPARAVPEPPPPQPAPAPIPPAAAPEAAPAAEPASAPSEAVLVEAADDPMVLQRQRALQEHRRLVIQAADEKAFDTLNLPDAQRAAIRRINDEYVRALHAMQPGAAEPNSGVDLNADQTRRAAIENVLGAEGMPAFTVAERRAERRVRAQLRPELVRGR